MDVKRLLKLAQFPCVASSFCSVSNLDFVMFLYVSLAWQTCSLEGELHTCCNVETGDHASANEQ